MRTYHSRVEIGPLTDVELGRLKSRLAHMQKCNLLSEKVSVYARTYCRHTPESIPDALDYSRASTYGGL